MKIILKVLLLTFLSQQMQAQRFKKIHYKAIVVDTHNDILMRAADIGAVMDKDLTGKSHSDLARWKKGGLDVQLFSVYTDGDRKDAYAYALREMDSLNAVIARNPDKIIIVHSYKEILKAVKQKKIAAMFGVEGGHMIENDLTKLDSFYKRGTRYLTLTHNIAPNWASSAADEAGKKEILQKGLNDFGKAVIKKMNELGILIDVSHAGDETFWNVIALSNKPIIASHSSVYALTPHRRNLKDEQIRAIAKNGGVIQVNFNPGFIDSNFSKKEKAFLAIHKTEMDSLIKSGMDRHYAVDHIYYNHPDEANAFRPQLSKLIDHIDYIVKLVGVNYVGLGSDFDGINVTPLQLDDVSSYPGITEALLKKGYSKKDIYKILGGNFLRVLKANEKN